MVKRSELIDYFESNADTYLFLSQMFFKELNDETIEILEAQEFSRDTGYESLDKGYALLRRYFNFAARDKRTQLACEYARIFLAAGVQTRERRTATPYESVFTSEEHIVMQESRDDVVRIYKRDGFQVDPELHEPEDHLAFELEYLSRMSRSAADLLRTREDFNAFEENIGNQLDFIETHLLNWIPELLDVAQKFAKLAFYLGMINVAIGMLEQTQDTLRDLIDTIENGSGEIIDEDDGDGPEDLNESVIGDKEIFDESKIIDEDENEDSGQNCDSDVCMLATD